MNLKLNAQIRVNSRLTQVKMQYRKIAKIHNMNKFYETKFSRFLLAELFLCHAYLFITIRAPFVRRDCPLFGKNGTFERFEKHTWAAVNLMWSITNTLQKIPVKNKRMKKIDQMFWLL